MEKTGHSGTLDPKVTGEKIVKTLASEDNIIITVKRIKSFASWFTERLVYYNLYSAPV